MPGRMHYRTTSFSSHSLAGECKKAEKILDSFINPELVSADKRIPPHILENAKGLAIFTVVEVGMMRSLRFGSGLVVARLPNGTWSAPSAITTGKLVSAGQFGLELTDYVYVLNTTHAVEKFAQGDSFTLGRDVSVAAGPFGRSAELAGDQYTADVGILAYCKTKSVFGGSTLEGTSMGEKEDLNRKIYHGGVSPRELLRGEVALPAETYSLMKLLHSTLLRPAGSDEKARARARDRAGSRAGSLASAGSGAGGAVKDENRFYGQTIAAPHRITIQVTDWSAVELPSSLTDPGSDRGSMDTQSECSLSRHPTVLHPGRRSWSGSSSSWCRHDPLDF
ncbi:hypothetical protein BDV18DRAFT_159114 [Aspergillus unguis]